MGMVGGSILGSEIISSLLDEKKTSQVTIASCVPPHPKRNTSGKVRISFKKSTKNP
jgi:hypothetical protein